MLLTCQCPVQLENWGIVAARTGNAVPGRTSPADTIGRPDGKRSPRPGPQCELNRLKHGCEHCCGAGEQNKTAVPFIGMYGLNGL